MTVSRIVADSNVVKFGRGAELLHSFDRGNLVGYVFEHHGYSGMPSNFGDRGVRVFEHDRVEGLSGIAEMHDDIFGSNPIGKFQTSFDLVNCGFANAPLRIKWRDPLPVWPRIVEKRQMNRRSREFVFFEP